MTRALDRAIGKLNPKTFTATIVIATGIFTSTAYGLPTGTPLLLGNVGGALPTGLSIGAVLGTQTGDTTNWRVQSGGTVVFLIVIDANTYRVASTYANAMNGVAITLTGTQSGTHTVCANFVKAQGGEGFSKTAEIFTGGAISITSQTMTQIIAMSMTGADDIGVWEFTGQSDITTGGGALSSECHCAITTIPPPAIEGAPDQNRVNGNHVLGVANQSQLFPIGPTTIVIHQAITVYLTAYIKFGTNSGVGDNNSGTCIGFGFIKAKQL